MRWVILNILLLWSMGSIAQETVPPNTDPQQEIRALSGTIKDLLGQVHEQLGRIDATLKDPLPEKTSALLMEQREDLLEEKEDLEEALTEINSDRVDRTEAKREAQEAIDSASGKLKEIKGSIPSAVN